VVEILETTPRTWADWSDRSWVGALPRGSTRISLFRFAYQCLLDYRRATRLKLSRQGIVAYDMERLLLCAAFSISSLRIFHDIFTDPFLEDSVSDSSTFLRQVCFLSNCEGGCRVLIAFSTQSPGKMSGAPNAQPLEWNTHRAEIEDLYMSSRRPLEDVMTTLQIRYSFIAR
jgi:hypothetical protein